MGQTFGFIFGLFFQGLLFLLFFLQCLQASLFGSFFLGDKFSLLLGFLFQRQTLAILFLLKFLLFFQLRSFKFTLFRFFGLFFQGQLFALFFLLQFKQSEFFCFLLCEELGLLLGLQFLRQPLGFFFGALSLLFQSQGERGLLFGDQVSFVFGIKFPGLLQDLALCWPS